MPCEGNDLCALLDVKIFPVHWQAGLGVNKWCLIVRMIYLWFLVAPATSTCQAPLGNLKGVHSWQSIKHTVYCWQWRKSQRIREIYIFCLPYRVPQGLSYKSPVAHFASCIIAQVSKKWNARTFLATFLTFIQMLALNSLPPTLLMATASDLQVSNSCI